MFFKDNMYWVDIKIISCYPIRSFPFPYIGRSLSQKNKYLLSNSEHVALLDSVADVIYGDIMPLERLSLLETNTTKLRTKEEPVIKN